LKITTKLFVFLKKCQTIILEKTLIKKMSTPISIIYKKNQEAQSVRNEMLTDDLKRKKDKEKSQKIAIKIIRIKIKIKNKLKANNKFSF
jgi:hypothetical protein